ncbi:uncharacterized protein LOC107793897 [Nicotiana tabacum]|uniref:Uncharacterized protein LOC107793897 n=1 Tax=Nicotiana tabacum TaxID=4097 RepID=A0A1S4A5A2_TOBAC|nr:PREDICTED: uncharacterized protein LOC107793897 [Nicotiana tabacum]XP_018622058.1 uncharacterized protein LOC104121217 isoform X3 [Nicotiana tomentosiformis]XP_018622059.1 uncharacterized protein LOC104121217 isoform X4 [Nicotiana tomentosiformis]
MKFLPEFALCWGGATINPTVTEVASVTTPQPQEEEQNRGRNSSEAATPQGRGRRVVKPKNVANWKPALRVISEERVMSDIVGNGSGGRSKERAAVPSSCTKSAAKVKAKSIARSQLSPRHGDDYWKSTGPMAVPAFSPTAFLF